MGDRYNLFTCFLFEIYYNSFVGYYFKIVGVFHRKGYIQWFFGNSFLPTPHMIAYYPRPFKYLYPFQVALLYIFYI